MKLHIYAAFFFILPLVSAITLRCHNRDIDVKEDYFGLWSINDNIAYTMDELAINDGSGTCQYYGKGVTTQWKRHGGLDLSSVRGEKLSMIQIVNFHRLIYALKRKHFIVEEQKSLRNELEMLEHSAEICLRQLQKK